MSSPESLKYILLCLQQAHQTYQTPLIWNEKMERFSLDNSSGFRFLSKVILAVDIFNITCATTLGIFNHVAGLELRLTLFLFGGGILSCHSVCLDVMANWFGIEFLAGFEAFFNLARKEGNSKS